LGWDIFQPFLGHRTLAKRKQEHVSNCHTESSGKSDLCIPSEEKWA
jgi:hypothetical protein